MFIRVTASDDVTIMNRARKKLARITGVPEKKVTWLSVLRVAVYRYLREEEDDAVQRRAAS